jgi:hypothetical protein
VTSADDQAGWPFAGDELFCPRCFGNLVLCTEGSKAIAECPRCHVSRLGGNERWRRYVPRREWLPDREPSWLTVCCGRPILDRSDLTYECPEHAYRHVLPLSALHETVRKRILEARAQPRGARKGRPFVLGLLVVSVAITVLSLVLR